MYSISLRTNSRDGIGIRYGREQGWVGLAKPYVFDELFYKFARTRRLEISTRGVFGTNVSGLAKKNLFEGFRCLRAQIFCFAKDIWWNGLDCFR